MEDPGEPAIALLRCRLRFLMVGDQGAGERERKQGQGEGAAHERLISKRSNALSNQLSLISGRLGPQTDEPHPRATNYLTQRAQRARSHETVIYHLCVRSVRRVKHHLILTSKPGAFVTVSLVRNG